ncbi:hypothetical protein ACDF64_01375 [Agromyces sp. MMS24-JH15]|uniref:hypothetical protein n=1 Tax=Agromyces sp. MMS24-JH15 TaxID=3243765 RepID=UPI0037478A4E
MRRSTRWSTARSAALVALAASVLAVGSALATGPVLASASAAEQGGPSDAPGPTELAIPYLGTERITPAAPWRIADCGAVLGASPLVVGCTEEGVDLAAPAYDPAAGATALRVPLTNGSVSMTVEYRVTTAAPDAPLLRPAQSARPAAAGSLVRVPISDLGVACTPCAAGGTVEAVGVEPASAGSAWVTPTHVVFRAAADYAGPVEVHARIADDVGTWSAEASVHFGVYRPERAPLIALDVFAPLEAGAATVDLRALVTSIAGDDVVLVGCGGTLHGRVSCDADGRATYVGTGAVDQFSFQVAAGGEQAGGSVTLVPAGGTLPTTGPVPMAPVTGDVALAVIPPAPAGHDGTTTGIFTPLVATLDRVGAR